MFLRNGNEASKAITSLFPGSEVGSPTGQCRLNSSATADTPRASALLSTVSSDRLPGPARGQRPAANRPISVAPLMATDRDRGRESLDETPDKVDFTDWGRADRAVSDPQESERNANYGRSPCSLFDSEDEPDSRQRRLAWPAAVDRETPRSAARWHLAGDCSDPPCY